LVEPHGGLEIGVRIRRLLRVELEDLLELVHAWSHNVLLSLGLDGIFVESLVQIRRGLAVETGVDGLVGQDVLLVHDLLVVQFDHVLLGKTAFGVQSVSWHRLLETLYSLFKLLRGFLIVDRLNLVKMDLVQHVSYVANCFGLLLV